jgi:uncharacterized Fe-S radical SAM superfamily protein PflX
MVMRSGEEHGFNHSFLYETALPVEAEVLMKCDFERLWLYLNKKLDSKEQLEVLDHLSKCEICCEAICQIARDQDSDYFIKYELKKRMAS